MTDIELVIKIPKESYKILKSGVFIDFGERSGKTILQSFCRAIWNGKPLPKGHGKLKDVGVIEAVLDLENSDNAIAKALKNIIESVPTLIEADTTESEG